ncbi:hypothetical protein VNO78_18362 [Psophocarpus tetragonolobus]|uniref:PB1-like domain-containing protein n=1 Tax=Psophocarpus tetragonolobus TaxID=3891 RepID=A0AAN9SKS9_PSOTE
MNFTTLILHHVGKLLRNYQKVLEYVGGEIDVWEELECNLLNRFLIIDLCKLHKYHDIQHFYWLYPERDFDIGLREIRKDYDIDITDLCLASKHNNEEIEVFFKHHVFQMNIKEPGEEDVESRVEDVVEKGLEEDSFSDAYTDNYENVEDNLYRSSPIVSDGDE